MAEGDKAPFELLPKITTRGDIGAAGVGLAIGYFADAAFHPFGIPPGQASLYSAAAAVGIKNLVQSWLESRRRPVESGQSPDAVSEKRERLRLAGERMIKILEEVPLGVQVYVRDEAVRSLKETLNLAELNLLDDDQFQKALQDVAKSDIMSQALRKTNR